MHRSIYELMQDQVRAIYRALTGSDLPAELPRTPLPPHVDAPELVWSRFAEVDGWARVIPPLAERVPPFAFSPPMDVVVRDREILVELAIPGVAREDIHVELTGNILVISGTRAGERAANGRTYRHAEIPRGPFRRALVLPQPVAPQPRVEVDNGIVRIQLAQPPSAAQA